MLIISAYRDSNGKYFSGYLDFCLKLVDKELAYALLESTEFRNFRHSIMLTENKRFKEFF